MDKLFESLDVENQIDISLQRFLKWKKDDKTVVFPLMTDLHSALATRDPLRSMHREAASHIRIMNRAAERFGADFSANLGDVGLDVPLTAQEDEKELFSRVLAYHRECSIRPVLFAIGNHDTCSGNVTAADWGKAFREINSDCFMITGTDDAYGFYDVPGKELRVFWLFCNETKDYYSEEQLEFVREHLENMPENMTAVVMQHICILKMGRWKNRINKEPPQKFLRLHEIFADFVKNGGKMACCIAGDSHFGGYESSDGVNYFVFQGYGGIGDNERPDHAVRSDEFNPICGFRDTFDSTRTFIVDMVAVKPEKKEIAVFRIGSGGEDFDQFAQWQTAK